MASKPETFNLDSLTTLAAEVIALRNLGVAVASVLGTNLEYTSLSTVGEALKSKISYSQETAAKAQAELSKALKAAGCDNVGELVGWIRESAQLRKLIQNGTLPGGVEE